MSAIKSGSGYEERINSVVTYPGPFQEHGAEVIEYILESDRNYVKAWHVEDEIGLNSRTATKVLKGLGEFYGLEIEAEMGDPTQYELEPIRDQSLEQLKTELE